MAETVTGFYSTENFLHIRHAINLAMFNHFSNLLFNGDTTRIVYSSNAYAFRTRSNNNDGNLNLPFLNFRTTNYQAGERTWWNAFSYGLGRYLPELGEVQIQFAPVTISYEASFWCSRDDDLSYAFSEVMWDADNKTMLQPYVEIDSETLGTETGVQQLAIPGLLGYTGLSFEPTYNEQDWLDRNNIHSASLDFDIDSFALKTNDRIYIPTEVLLEFAYKFYSEDDISTDSYDDLYTLVVNHMTEEVEESES